jgi:hypothetical protein
MAECRPCEVKRLNQSMALSRTCGEDDGGGDAPVMLQAKVNTRELQSPPLHFGDATQSASGEE